MTTSSLVGHFKNAIKAGVTDTSPAGDTALNGFTTIYRAPTSPSLYASYLIECDIACTGNTGVQASVRIKTSLATAYLVKEAPVPLGSTLQVIDGQKVVLGPGDSIEVKCLSAGQTVDVVVSLVENVNP
jgi:hypothetical protein